MARQQVRPIRQPERLRPAPLQSDRFTGAPRVSGAGDNYSRLAQALGGLSRDLGVASRTAGSIGVDAASRQDNQDDLTERNKFLSLSQREQAQIAQTGVFPDGETLESKQLRKAAGMADASEFTRGLRNQMLENFDWQNGDVQAYLAGAKRKYIQESGISDQHTINGFYKEFNRLETWASRQQEKRVLDQRQELKSNVTFDTMKETVYSGIEDGLSAQEIQTRVRGLYPELGNKNGLDMPYEEMDQNVIAIASTIAENHPEVAIELLTSERPGGGPGAKPLTAKKKTFAQVNQILSRSSHAIRERKVDQGLQQLQVADVNRVLSGDYSPFQPFDYKDANGETQRLSTKERQRDFVENFQARLRGMVENGRMDRTEAVVTQLKTFSNMNIEMPFLSERVDGIEKRFRPDDLESQDRMDELRAVVDRYKFMRNNAKNYTMSHLSTDTKEWLSSYETAQKYLDANAQDAALFADRVLNPTAGMKTSLSYRRDEIQSRIRKEFDSWLPGDPDRLNTSAYIARAQDLAERFMAAGTMSVDRAVEASMKSLHENSYVYDGTIIPNMEQFSMAPRWKDGMEKFLSDYRELDARGRAYEGGKILPVATTAGQLWFVDAETGEALKDASGGTLRTNVRTINNIATSIQEAEDQKVIDGVIEENRGRRSREETPHSDRGQPVDFQ